MKYPPDDDVHTSQIEGDFSMDYFSVCSSNHIGAATVKQQKPANQLKAKEF
jgi:hypothetical protein